MTADFCFPCQQGRATACAPFGDENNVPEELKEHVSATRVRLQNSPGTLKLYRNLSILNLCYEGD